MANQLLKGKKGIIFGALDPNSIAWKVALRAHEEGAVFTLTNAPVAMRMGAINQLATGAGIGIAALPILTILLLWLLPRLRFVRRAGRAQKLVDSGAGVDLLALRALASQKIEALTEVDRDAMAAWRRGDEVVMRKLAALELKASGVRFVE